MSPSENQITVTCPKCQHKFSIDDALVPQIAEAKEEFRQKMIAWQKETSEKIQKNTEERLKKEILKENEQELKILKEQNIKQAEELAKTKELELEIRKEKNKLDEEKKDFELKVQRQLDEERKNIQEKTETELNEKFHLREKDKDQMIESLKKSLDEAQRKANQGSQQMQGEVLELELEELLRKTFPLDEILPVGKGINGADVIQKVRGITGQICGTIIWESKRTKNWTEGWVLKLKDDLRSAKGDVAVLVSAVLPSEVNKFGPRDGIYITNFESFLSVAALLRIALIDQNKTKLSVVGKNEKMEAVYNYLSGNEFRQRVEAIVESFSGMQSDLEKEKRMYTQIWAKREKQIQRVLENTVGMHGDLQGLMGTSLQQLPSLEIEVEEIEIKISDSIS